MENSTRLQYLEAMGIDVWVCRKEPEIEATKAVVEVDVVDDTEIVAPSPVVIEDQWSLLRNQVIECSQCALSKTRTQTVFGEGRLDADWMLIGEAPGQNEDLEGKPFLGASGLLLTEMLRAIGLEREQVYITNVVKCSPADNVSPKVEELKSCGDYLQRQIDLVKPKIILAVGRIAAQSLLGTKQPLAELRGRVHHIKDIPLLVIYHPAYLLRSLLEKRKVWQDLQLAMKIYQEEK